MFQGRRQAALTLAGSGLLVVAGLAAYGFTLRLPFFSDDMALLRFLQGSDLAGIWLAAGRLGSYRPLQLVCWQALIALQGWPDPFTFHALNTGLHILNAILLLVFLAGRRPQQAGGGALGRSGGDLLLGLAAALLFLFFPFSYQAVPWVGALNHMLVIALILGALLFDRAARRSAGPRRGALLGAAWFLALLAPFANETGVLVAPLFLLVQLTAEDPLPWQKALRRSLPYWVCTLIGVIVFLLAPKEGSRGALLSPSAWWQNGVYFAQGLAYPVAPLAGRIPAIGAWAATALVALAAITGWAALGCWGGRGRLVLLAAGWFALAAAPVVLVLDAEYVRSGARLLYEAALGAVLFWCIPLSGSFAAGRRRLQQAGLGLSGLAVLWASILGFGFIRRSVPLYEQMRLAVTQLVANLPQGAEEPILCVNYPAWFAPAGNLYPIGHEGVVLIPMDYSNVAQLLWAHTQDERPVQSVVFFDLLPQEPWRFIFPCIGEPVDSGILQGSLREVKRVIVAGYGGPDVALYDAGGLEAENQAPAEGYLALYGEQVALTQAVCERRAGELRLTLRWQARQAVEQETTVFVHLYDSAGKLVAQADGYPLMGTARLVSWRPGDEWRDVRVLQLPAGLPAGEYTVKAGLYPVAGGDRLHAAGPAGEGFADEAVPVAQVRLP